MPNSPLPLTDDERARSLLAEIDGPRCPTLVHDCPIQCSSPAGHEGLCTPETGTPWATVAALRDVLTHLARVEGERDTARAESARLTREMAEARATIENDQGTGTPPADGWEYLRGQWFRRRDVNDPRNEGADVRERPNATPPHRWRWTVHGANGWQDGGDAPTAREAMRAADVALAGGGS